MDLHLLEEKDFLGRILEPLLGHLLEDDSLKKIMDPLLGNDLPDRILDLLQEEDHSERILI